MEGRFLLIASCVIAGCMAALPAQAYDDRTTHPALTGEIVTLYNRIFPEDAVTDAQRALLVRGSTEEDQLPRSFNHLYDPVHDRGWSAQHAGWVPATLARVLALLAFVPDAPLANVAWVDADAAQEAYARYGGNRTWSAGLRAAARGDEQGAYLALGSALHLLEDAGVPDHARDDTHVHAVDFITGDPGSPFEDYTARYAPGSLRIADRLQVARSAVPRYPQPAAYLDDNARFSANSFFSRDTVQDASFPLPVVSREAGDIAYGRTMEGGEVPIARRVRRLTLFSGITTSLEVGFGKDFEQIHEAQFQLLARRTLLLGVGMIRDFRAAEKQVAEGPAADRYVFSLVAEADRLIGAAAELARSAASKALAQLDRAYAWLTGGGSSLALEQVQPTGSPAGPTGIVTAGAQKKTTKDAQVMPAGSVLSASTGQEAETPNCPAGGPAKVVVNEIAWMGTQASANDEWIELANLEDDAVILQGWELADTGGIYIDLDAVQIPAHGFALLERTDDSSVPTVKAQAIYKGALTNSPSGYAMELQAPGCGTVDRVEASSKWPAGDAASRRTMERKKAGGWQTSALPGGTPGKANSEGYQPQATSTSSTAPASTDSHAATSSSKQDAPDAPGPDTASLFLSEIQAGGADAGDEFVELYNPNDRSVSVAGWSLQYFAASETAVAQKRDLPDLSVPAHGYLLVAREMSGGADGYRGATVADYVHRSYTLSGAGATVALVRSMEKAASTSDASVVDWVRYPKLLAGQSYERAAEGAEGCLDPRPGMPGELLGNGCASWYLRDVAEPQNRLSLPEPRTLAAENRWIVLPASGWQPEGTAQSWSAFALMRGSGAFPETISTADGLSIGGAIPLSYAACVGSELVMQVLLLPLSPVSCQNGGLLNGAFAGPYWEDGQVTVQALLDLFAGEVLQLARYAFSFGGGGQQVFSLAEVGAYVVSDHEGLPPSAPGPIQVDDHALPQLTLTWQAALDPDSIDAELSYEMRIATTTAGNWIDLGRELRYGAAFEPGDYTVAVRARDPQDNLGPMAQASFSILAPDPPEQFGHEVSVAPGVGAMHVASDVRIAGIALWVMPQGGWYCCANAVVELRDDAGSLVGSASSGRRIVDGEGDTEFLFESPVDLARGTYWLSVVPGEISNAFLLGAVTGGEWGGAQPYLRLLRTH